ncbi:MAG: hypothetical protein O2799_07620 [Planctomycetota bacterium]|nr:hypothetical protein [Planctomycetota bacterium]
MEFLKYIVILATAPIWMPFAKELWGEFLLAMRADGGLLKAPPGPVERKRLQEELKGEELRVVHIRKEDRRFRRPEETARALQGVGPQTGIVARPFRDRSKRSFQGRPMRG